MVPAVHAGSLPTGFAGGSDDVVFSLEARDRDLKTVLSLISDATGCRIEVDRAWEGEKVSFNVRNVTLDEGLRSILSDYNHVLIYKSDGAILVVIRGVKSATPPGGGQSIDSVQGMTASEDLPLPAMVPPGEEEEWQQEVLPPPGHGEKGFTAEELNTLLESGGTQEPLEEEEILPPSSP